jgi:16S rRNA (cytidine1402-2'-O)-methyltransferase
MPGTLYVVATPIGNLEDVTLRALRVLREVSVIAAEDTRRTARLLQHYSISTPTTSLHEHNEHVRSQGLIERLTAGESVALVSDAGTPVVSDPGVRLVASAHAHGIRVEPVPGPSAAVAAVSAAGIPGDGFLFAGFPPSRSKARKEWLHSLREERRPLVLYEAPHRILATLRDIASELGDRTVAIARELTKSHEDLAVRPIARWLDAPPLQRGEFTLVISGLARTTGGASEVPDDGAISLFFGHLTDKGALSRRDGLKATAKHFDISARDVFAAIERVKLRSGDIK